jgi:hypothetical protein
VLLALVPLALAVQAPAPADVLTSHNTPGRLRFTTTAGMWRTSGRMGRGGWRCGCRQGGMS